LPCFTVICKNGSALPTWLNLHHYIVAYLFSLFGREHKRQGCFAITGNQRCQILKQQSERPTLKALIANKASPTRNIRANPVMSRYCFEFPTPSIKFIMNCVYDFQLQNPVDLLKKYPQ
jgi:hypothetical protein